MKFQRSKSSCGPAALANALECLGIRRSEEELATLCRQTTDGTDAANLVAAARKIEGVRGIVISESRADVGLLRLTQCLYEGRPAIVCVNSKEPWDHYAVVVGFLGFNGRLVCVDSADGDLVRTRSLDEFVGWWKGPEGSSRPFWAVVL